MLGAEFNASVTSWSMWIIRRIMRSRVRLIVGGNRALRNPLWIVQHISSYLKIKIAKIKIACKLGDNAPIKVALYGHGLWVRPFGPDHGVGIDTLGDEFDPLIGILPQDFDGLIVDGGGYIGTAAIRLGEIYSKATVITIEPHTENYSLLERNISGKTKIIAIKAALVPEIRKGTVNVYDVGSGSWGFTVEENAKGKTKSKVADIANTITLSDICGYFSNAKIGIVKLDIEGSEKALFESNDRNLLNDSFVLVELHERKVKGCNAAFKDFSKGRKIIKSKFHEKYLVYPNQGKCIKKGGTQDHPSDRS